MNLPDYGLTRRVRLSGSAIRALSCQRSGVLPRTMPERHVYSMNLDVVQRSNDSSDVNRFREITRGICLSGEIVEFSRF